MWLGKRRSKYGKFLDDHLGYGAQEKVKAISGLSKETISKACTDDQYKPTNSTINLLLSTIRQLTGKNVNKDDFWM